MTIARVETFAIRHVLPVVRSVSVAEIQSHDYVLVKLTDTEGVVGWGETYLIPGMQHVIAETAPLLIGLLPERARNLPAALERASRQPWAASAVMIALEDLRGRRAGASIASLTGGAARSQVRAYAASTGYFANEPPEETWLAEARTFVDAGFTAIKLRIGRYPIGREAKALARLRAEVPDGVALMADGNAAYTMAEALEMGARLHDLGYEWFEEPLPQFPGYPAYEHLTRSLPIPIAGGEGVSDRAQALDLLRRRGVDIFQPEPVICGGIGEAVFMAELARVHGISTLPHTSGGGIGLAAALQVLATVADQSTSPSTWGPYLELGTEENPARTRLFGGASPFELVDGRVTIPTGPGLGLEVDEEWVRAAATEITDSARR